jgi:hypothetical protein
MTPIRAGLLVGSAMFLLYAGIANTFGVGWVGLSRLARDGRVTEARITRMEHSTCFFEYSVGSVTYHGSEVKCASYVGQRRPINYMPTDPSFVSLGSGSPQLDLAIEVIGGLVAAVLVGSIFVVALALGMGRPTQALKGGCIVIGVILAALAVLGASLILFGILSTTSCSVHIGRASLP